MAFHNVKITVLDCKCYEDLQQEYLADPKSGSCPVFHPGDEFLVTPDEWVHMLNGKFCTEAEKVMIACCNDGTRPVIFKLERMDTAE